MSGVSTELRLVIVAQMASQAAGLEALVARLGVNDKRQGIHEKVAPILDWQV